MSEPNQQSNKSIWLAIALVAATLVALAVGGIFRAAGADAIDAMTAAGGAFVATLTVFFAAWAFLH